MKKLLTLSLIASFLVFATTVSAGIGIIPLAGVNMGSWSFDPELGDDTTVSMGMGIAGGAGVQIGLGIMAVEIDMLYAQKGTKIQSEYSYEALVGFDASWNPIYETQDIVSDDTTVFNYLCIPILVKAVLPAGPANIIIGAGPEIGLFLSGKASGTTSINGEDIAELEYTDEEVEKESVNSMDLGLAISVGAEISGVVLDVRYVLGLSNLVPDDQGGDIFTVKNNSIQILLGYKIGL